MLSSLSRFFGKRKSLPNDFQSCVEILSWYHPEYLPTQHLALRIRDGNETHYLSFSPKIVRDRPKRSILQLRQGVDAFFVNHYEDELLIRGFRNAWPQIKDDLTTAHQQFFKKNNFKTVSDIEVLEIAGKLPAETQTKLRKLGNPTEVIELRSLNVKAMIQKMHAYKTATIPIQWSFWSGTYLHAANTHNCASIVLDLLYTGGMGNLIHSYRDVLTIAGTLLGVSYVFMNSETCLETMAALVPEIFKNAAIGLVVGRGIGGFIEGYTEIQSFLNLGSIKGKDNTTSVLGLRFVSASLSALIGFIKQGPIVPSVLTMPREVLNLAHQAKVEEEDTFSFSTNQVSAISI